MKCIWLHPHPLHNHFGAGGAGHLFKIDRSEASGRERENEKPFIAILLPISSRILGPWLSTFHNKEDGEKLLPQIFRMAEQRLHDRQSFMLSTASRYYYYLIFLQNCVISKEVHSPPRLTIINKIIPKQGEKKFFPQELRGERHVEQYRTAMWPEMCSGSFK